MARSGGICLLVAAAAGCSAPPAPDPWTLWTIDTLEARRDLAVVDAGAQLALLTSPYPLVTSKTGVQRSGLRGLTVFPAFSEGATAAYMTTEIWQDFDEIWVQPLYVDSTRKNPPVFGVGAGTRFYSPYWQVFFYAHPGGKEFHSAKDVLDSGAALTPGTAKFCALTQDAALGTATQQNDAAPVRPITGEAVTAAANASGYAEGKKVWFIDLGNQQRFTYDPGTLVVEETPLFGFALKDGTLLDLPKVGGTGPWHSPRCDGNGTCTGVSDGVPQFGSLWRVWQVLLDPAAADVYVPSNLPELRNRVKSMGFALSLPDGAAPDPARYTLRVVANGPDCASGAKPCVWLDAQNRIESLLPDWKVTRTGTDVSCPLVQFKGATVPPPP